MKKLHKLGEKIAELDVRIVEVFIHSDTPRDPLESDEIYIVCSIADPEITNNIDAYNDAGFSWALDMQDKTEGLRKELEIEPEIVLAPFNFDLHADGEYGEYYSTLFIKEGYTPVLEIADKEQYRREQDLLRDVED
jgi:hypothetical protein